MIARRAGGFQRVTAVASAGVVDKLRIGHDGAGLDRLGGQGHVACRVVVHQVVEVAIATADRPVLLDDPPLRVIDHNVVGDQHVGGAVDIDAPIHVVEHGVIGDRDRTGRMVEVETEAGAAVDHVVPHVTAHIGMVDPMHALVERRPGADVMHRIADGVIVAGGKTGVVDAGSAVAAADCCSGGNIVHVVTDDAVVRSPVGHAETAVAVASQIETDDIDVGTVEPENGVGRIAADMGVPFLVRDEADARRGRAAVIQSEQVLRIRARGHVHGSARAGCVGGVLQCLPGTARRPAIAVIACRRYVVARGGLGTTRCLRKRA